MTARIPETPSAGDPYGCFTRMSGRTRFENGGDTDIRVWHWLGMSL